jgi:hypothetical protein
MTEYVLENPLFVEFLEKSNFAEEYWETQFLTSFGEIQNF